MIKEYFCVGISAKNSSRTNSKIKPKKTLDRGLYLGFCLTDVDKLISVNKVEICLIPGVPDFWLGTINDRGSLLWILDTPDLFKLSKAGIDGVRKAESFNAIILKNQLEDKEQKLALSINHLLGIISCQESELTVGDLNNFPLLSDLATGVVEQNNKSIYLVDSAILFEKISQNFLVYS